MIKQATGPACFLRVAVDTPAAVAAATGEFEGLYDYRWNGGAIVSGELVLVPFGARQLVGIVASVSTEAATPPDRIRDVVARVSGVSPLAADWLALASFAARYYHRPVGEVMLPALPVAMRTAARYETVAPSEAPATVTLPAIARAQARAAKLASRSVAGPGAKRTRRAELSSTEGLASSPPSDVPSPPSGVPSPPSEVEPLTLNPLQTLALAGIVDAMRATVPPRPILLHGITGSGKTEVYLRAVADVVAAGLQALVLVPEINLTPQLAGTFAARLPGARVASLHSGHAAGQRLEQWMAAHEGIADVLLGTRLAVLASLPRLGLIVVDEEHDASYKQQEGLRYSARDLAVARGKLGREGHAIPVVLASATPSMESWAHAQSGHYRKLVLSTRAVPEASLPTIRLVPTLRAEVSHGLTTTVRDAIADRIARREPVLVFHNRRGYAPVLTCGACGWLSACPRCSVNAVFHKADRQLHCHHCGWQHRVPRACPDCGNVDLAAVGRGTQRVEESLRTLFPDARIARIDRDSTRRKGAAAGMLDAVHDGSLDILIGTQMLAKGHDFRNVTLVCVLDADNALYSHDFRASERLFSNLMQVAGRAGRGGTRSDRAEVLIQTRAPEHPLFAALIAHDFERFAASQLEERAAAGLPPYAFQAVLRAEAADAAATIAFLQAVRRDGAEWLADHALADTVDLYDPVPMTVARVAHVERAQLLIESKARGPLHAFVDALLARLQGERTKVRWHVEIDPLEI